MKRISKLLKIEGNPAEVEDYSPKGTLRIKNNNISIQPDVLFDLMNINGKPVKMRIFKNGGFETTAQPMLSNAKPSQKTFTLKEYEEVDRIAFLLHGLYSIADGDWNSDLFDYCMKISCFNPPYNLTKELSKISIDPAKPFTVNGKAYICKRNCIFSYNVNI